MRKSFIFFTALLFFILWLAGNLTLLESVSVCIFVFYLLDFLDRLGKKIVILDLTIMMATLTCLIMPVIFYHYYSRENDLARIWVKYMPVSSDDYFSFMVPATLAMILGLRIPLGKSIVNKNPTAYMENVRRILKTKPNLGLYLIAVGVTSGLLDFISPKSLENVFYLSDHLTYVGVFYVIYSPSKHKRFIVPGVILLMLGQSLITGMFGDLIFMGACTLVLILLGTAISFKRKLLAAVAGSLLILVMQSVKLEYRERTWRQAGGGADPTFYAELIAEKVTDPSKMINPNQLFFTSVRMNQGWLVGMTMNRVPAKFDFAYGETIWQSVAAAIVPRFLWPDKPEAGGKANLKRFWGFNLVGFSMNIGPFGEGYANFDVTGGIIYMFCYGLLFNFVLFQILKFSEKRPTIILWLPFLYFYAIGVETDLLTTLGSLLKGLLFTWITFKAFRIAFRMDL